MPQPTRRDLVTVLSIDGGGIRGLIPALICAEIEARTGQPLASLFDLIAGTSTGGLLALGLTLPAASTDASTTSGAAEAARPARYRARELARFYEEEGPRIFDRSLLRKVRTAGGLIEERYADDGLVAVLEEYFGEARLTDALTEVLVTAYDIEERAPYFFKRHAARRAPARRDAPMRVAGRAASAAPTYFEPARLELAEGAPRTLIDGAVFAGNPAACAYAEAVAHFDLRTAPRPVLVVSLGTGTLTEPLSYREAKGWGALGWARPLIDIALNGADQAVDYQLRHLLSASDYYRFQGRLTEASDALDDIRAGNLRALRRHAERLIEARSEALDVLSRRLVGQEEEPT